MRNPKFKTGSPNQIRSLKPETPWRSRLSTVDEGGVAPAAIQGLNYKVERQEVELRNWQSEITELK